MTFKTHWFPMRKHRYLNTHLHLHLPLQSCIPVTLAFNSGLLIYLQIYWGIIYFSLIGCKININQSHYWHLQCYSSTIVIIEVIYNRDVLDSTNLLLNVMLLLSDASSNKWSCFGATTTSNETSVFEKFIAFKYFRDCYHW
jgi:hypothetical protein